MSLPAGSYYVGDLCYVMHDRWDEFCSITISERECLDGEFAFADGTRFASYRTAYGDGQYTDNQGRQYPVDAGLIGCVRVEDISEEERANIGDLGNIIDFPKEFETSSFGGWIRFGHIVIDTDPEPFEEDLLEGTEYFND